MDRNISFEAYDAPEARLRRRVANIDGAKRHPLLRLGQTFLAQARRFLTAQRQRLRMRRDEERLRQMSDHELRDIGLHYLSSGHFGRIPTSERCDVEALFRRNDVAYRAGRAGRTRRR